MHLRSFGYRIEFSDNARQKALEHAIQTLGRTTVLERLNYISQWHEVSRDLEFVQSCPVAYEKVVQKILTELRKKTKASALSARELWKKHKNDRAFIDAWEANLFSN
jgi:hypothetical protein